MVYQMYYLGYGWFFPHSYGYTPFFIKKQTKAITSKLDDKYSKSLSTAFESSKKDINRYTEDLILLFKGFQALVCN